MSDDTRQKWFEISPSKEPSFFLFLFYVVVWFTQLGERWESWTGGRIEAVVAGPLLAVVLFGTSKKDPAEKAGFTPFVASYFFALLIQVWNSWDSSNSWFFFTERVLKYSAMGLFISYFVRSPAKLRLFIFVWLLACFKIVLEGVQGGITGGLIWENQGIFRLHGSTKLYEHPNSLSQLALGTWPFIYYLWPTVQSIWVRIGMFALFLASMYCIVYTGSRTGYVGVMFMLGLIWMSSSRKMAILVTLLLLTPVAIKLTPEEYRERFMSSFVGREAEGRSKEGRIAGYGQGWEIFTRHPFGVGIGNYRLAAERYFSNGGSEIHCLYLEVLTHLGIHGAFIFMLLLLKSWLVLKKSLNRFAESAELLGQYSQADLRFMRAVGNATLVYMFVRLFVDILGMDLYGVCWWFIIGIGSALFFLSTQVDSSAASQASPTLGECVCAGE